MQRDEALAELQEMARFSAAPEHRAINWALAEIERLSAIPNQIGGLVKCAEDSDASERTTLLLKLAEAGQRIAAMDAALARIEGKVQCLRIAVSSPVDRGAVETNIGEIEHIAREAQSK